MAERDDVRMRGFRERADVDEVVRLVDAAVKPLPPEAVSVLEAAGRALARDAVSAVDVPAFARAAMDGYAVVAEATFGAAPDDPRVFDVAGESLPGRPPSAAVTEGACVRIMTGAPLPPGADSVVPVEQTGLEDGRVRVHAAVTPGRNVGQPGEDVKRGEKVLAAGRRLRAQDAAMLAAIGFGKVLVVRRPRVALVVTGDELLPAGSSPRGHAIVDANTPMLVALVRRDGGTPLPGAIVPDGRGAVKEALVAAAGSADCVLATGGSSVGAEDHLPMVLRDRGELLVHGVAMRPSSPTGFGRLGGTPVFLLPGNPVSCLCAYDFFAGRAIRTLAGLHPGWPHTVVRMPLRSKIASVLGRTDYVRVRIEEGKVVPLAIGGASILSSTVRAHGFVIVPRDSEGHAEGETVAVHIYSGA